MESSVAARWRASVARNWRIRLIARNDWWLLWLLLLLQLLEVWIFGETRNLVIGRSQWRWRNQRWGHYLFRQRMESVVVHRTPPISTAATTSAVAPSDRPELDQGSDGLVMGLPELLMNQSQRSDDSAVQGSHQIVWMTGLFHHHGDVVDPHRGRLFAIRQKVSRHFAFAFDFDSSAALELVGLVSQHLVDFLRYLD